MRQDERVVMVLAGLGGYAFRDLPRVWDVGIAEQTQVGVAAGMATQGKLPILYGIDTFLVRRAYEQIYLDFVQQDLFGLFIGLHGYEGLGPSHEGEECAGLMEGMGFEIEVVVDEFEMIDGVKDWVDCPRRLYLEVPA
jgi:transketolase